MATAKGGSGTGPVGQGDYVVQSGDCISSIAAQYGHFWQTIWTDPANAELRRVRGDPNVLFPGDRVTIPPLRIKEEPRSTEQRHRFRKKSEPTKLRLRLLEEKVPDEQVADSPPPKYSGRDVYSEDPPPPSGPVDRPRASVRYVLTVDGQIIDGQTDADGYLEAWIPGTARMGRLLVNPGTATEEEFTINLGHLDPVDEIAGVKQRLANLSFDCGDSTNEMTPGLQSAITAFQEKHGLEATGELTDEVRQKLRDLHGS